MHTDKRRYAKRRRSVEPPPPPPPHLTAPGSCLDLDNTLKSHDIHPALPTPQISYVPVDSQDRCRKGAKCSTHPLLQSSFSLASCAVRLVLPRITFKGLRNTGRASSHMLPHPTNCTPTHAPIPLMHLTTRLCCVAWPASLLADASALPCPCPTRGCLPAALWHHICRYLTSAYVWSVHTFGQSAAVSGLKKGPGLANRVTPGRDACSRSKDDVSKVAGASSGGPRSCFFSSMYCRRISSCTP